MSAYSGTPLDPQKVADLEKALFEIYKGAGVPVKKVQIVNVRGTYICQAIMASKTRGELPVTIKLPQASLDALKKDGTDG